jgi:hypothetical protein
VVDLGRLEDLSARIVPRLDQVLLVVTSELIAVHCAARTCRSLAGLGIAEDRLSLIHNRAGRWPAGASLLQAAVAAPVRVKLPDCEPELTAAYTKGRLIEDSRELGIALARFACELAGTEFKNPAGRGFSLKRLPLFGAREAATAPRTGG